MTAKLNATYTKICFFLFAVFLVSLPLTNVLFINVGFPFKIQEISLLLLLILLVAGPIRKNFVLQNKKFFRFFIPLAILAVIAFLKGYFTTDNLGKNASVLARISPTIDSLLKTFYVILSFLVFSSSRLLFTKNQSCIRYYFWGAWIASLTSVFFFLCGLFDVDTTTYFKWSSQVITLGHAKFIRNGTFLEGNFLGLYLLISFILATQYHRSWLKGTLSIAVVSTFSTPAILGLFLYQFISLARKTPIFPSLLIFLTAAAFANAKTHGKFLEEQFIQKLPIINLVLEKGYIQSPSAENNSSFNADSDEPEPTQTTALSATERAEMIKVGKQIFLQNPVFGVGPANYKFHFHEFTTNENMKDNRPYSANNIFIEILCEYGIIFFVIFALFFINLLKNSYLEGNMTLFSGAIPILIYFFSYPSFTIFYLWVYLALLSLKKEEQPCL